MTLQHLCFTYFLFFLYRLVNKREEDVAAVIKGTFTKNKAKFCISSNLIKGLNSQENGRYQSDALRSALEVVALWPHPRFLPFLEEKQKTTVYNVNGYNDVYNNIQNAHFHTHLFHFFFDKILGCQFLAVYPIRYKNLKNKFFL